MTDLKKMHDHPANVLRTAAQGAPPVAMHYGIAAAALQAYESGHDVTFAALDNDTLQAVREAYAGVIDDEALIAAVRDLLGLDD